MYLEPARLRLLAVVGGLILVIVIGVVVIGGGGDAPDEEAREAAERFASAIEDGDFETACGLMTDALRSSAGGEQCSDQLAARVGGGAADVEIEVVAVSVSGPKARAETRVRPAEDRPAREGTLGLEHDDAGWQVSDFGG